MSELAITAVDRAALPAAVRNGSPERRERYEAALGFERALIGQMTEQLMGSIGSEDSSAAMKAMRDSLPDALTDALIGAGGIGLAAQLDLESATDAVHTSMSDAGTAPVAAPKPSSIGDAGGVTA